ncbi:MAG: hypothetical protein HY042_06810 [Spirochaetia bacterium]|nr:hypothetical protein [Spirochaetia bacterium]
MGGGLGAAREETYFQDLKGYQGQANDLLDGAHIIPTSTAQSHTSLSPELEGEAGVGRAYASANIRDTRFHREYENDNFDRNPNGADFIRQARGLSTPISVSEEALRLGYEALETHGIRLGPSAGYTWMQTAQKSHNSGNNYFATGVTIRSVFQFKLSEDYRLRGGTAGLRGQVALPGDITAGADYNRAFVRGDYEFAQRGGAFFNVGTANVSSDSMRFVLHGPVSELRLNLLVPVGSHWYLKPEYTDAFTRIKADVIAWESSVMNSSLGIQENQPSLPNDVFLRSTSFLARGHDHFRSVTVAMVRRIELSR